MNFYTLSLTRLLCSLFISVCSGTDEALLTSRAPLLELQQKQYQEQKLYDERMNALREKVDRVRAGLRDFNEREIRRFDEESKPI